jgi:flavin-dependent dehydrogenase
MKEAVAIYDIAIIGGGLGGLTLAIQLAKQNRKVLLIEKETYPYHKVCGEYISNESWPFLISCGINLAEMNLPKIQHLGITAPNGTYLAHHLAKGGFGIARFTLDQLLAEQAKLNGVELIENCKANKILFENNQFEIQTTKGIFTSKYAFGAYGKKGNLDIQLNRDFVQEKKRGAKNYIGVKYHIQTSFPPDLIELHNFKDGYCGVSKIDNNQYCLCYLTTEENLKNNGNNIKAMEENILYKNPYLKTIFTQSTFLYQKPLSISQIRFEPKTQIENHFVLLGDAAGLITPLCGNGMSMAMRAAKIISQLLPTNLDDANERALFETNYKKAWKKAFKTRLQFGRIFQNLFGSIQTTHLILSILKPFPFVLKRLVRLTHGDDF